MKCLICQKNCNITANIGTRRVFRCKDTYCDTAYVFCSNELIFTEINTNKFCIQIDQDNKAIIFFKNSNKGCVALPGINLHPTTLSQLENKIETLITFL